MATINLGSIKFNWKGTYAGGTAYVVDDVVSYNGSSYICKLASTGNLPTNGTYWDVMSQAGTDGTDVGTTITTQGDILYRDGSGLQRLAKPASDKFLKNTSGGVLSWADAGGGKVLQVVQEYITTKYSSSSASWADFSGLTVFSITPSATSSKILILSNFTVSSANWNMLKFVTQTGGGGYGDFALPTGATGSQSNGHFGDAYDGGDAETNKSISWNYLHSPNTTSQVDYKLQARSWNPNTVYINRTRDDGNYHTSGNMTSSVTLIEIGA